MKSVSIPGVTVGNDATESLFDSEAVRKIMERHHDFFKKFREVEYSEKIKKADSARFFIKKRIKLHGLDQ